MKLVLLMLGKTRRLEIRGLLEDYVARIRRFCSVEIVEARDTDAAIKKLGPSRAVTALLVDAGGKLQDSESLAKWLGKQRDCGIREIIFVCGDAEGFPEGLRKRIPEKISLSSMTYSHELARVMLAEQLYRAFATLSGSPYPK
jgi:23S rRNA (pseudouridine1915-N3)-methyltransferase